jgi:DNA-binding Lrp family transcriptional regulator
MSDDIFKRLKAEYSKPTEVPPGFKSIEEIAKQLGLGRTSTKQFLKRALKDGRITRVEILRNCAVMHYFGPPGKSSSTPRPRRR